MFGAFLGGLGQELGWSLRSPAVLGRNYSNGKINLQLFHGNQTRGF